MNVQRPSTSDSSPSALLMRQRGAFLRDGAPDVERRRDALLRLKQGVVRYRREFEAAASADFGHRSAHETTLMDLVPIVQAINYQHRHVRGWMRPQRRRVSVVFQPGRARVYYQPLGVVGVISPWNFPVSLALMPLATALAAGNRAMLKPSELTPATSELLAQMLRESFDEDEVAVVNGGAQVAAAFAALPFDHLLFTGSTRIGRVVMQAASEHLVPVTLELGGKSPAIVAHGGSLERAARDIAYGKLANSGQICIAPDYALVHESEIEPFVRAYQVAIGRFYPNGAVPPDFTSIVNDGHYQRLRSLLEDARSKGARIVEIGSEAGGSKPAHTLAPTVVVGAHDDMRLMQEEIFGPVLPLVAYRTLDEAITYVNARPRPLALYFFGGADGARDVLRRTTSGNVTINDTLLHFMQEDLPFGGVGASGMGAYHGIEGFRALSHARGVFEQSRWNLTGLARPPYGRFAERLIRLLLR